jgi:hypothetical protein
LYAASSTAAHTPNAGIRVRGLDMSVLMLPQAADKRAHLTEDVCRVREEVA